MSKIHGFDPARPTLNKIMVGEGKRGYRPPVKAALWNSKRWDSKCEAEFVDYVPPSNPRLNP